MKTLKELQQQFNESTVPDDQKGKQKPYVSSDGKGNYEVLGNKGQTKQTFNRKEHGSMARDKAREHLKSKYNEYMKEEVDEICEAATAGLAAKAEKSGVSMSILRKVYNRGMAAWKTGNRPGTTPQQWAMARVNSYITKGKGTYHGADKDLREEEIAESNLPSVPKDKETGLPKKYVAGVSDSTAKARAAHFDKNKEKSDSDPTAYTTPPGSATAKTKESKHTKKYRDMFGEEMDEEIYEACWDSHKQVGLKKKGGKMVPNCVPKNEENIQELSKDTLDSYRRKAFDDQPSTRSDNPAKYDKRKAGRAAAFDKVLGRKPTKEAVDLPFDGPYTKTKPVKNSDGTDQSGMSRARELAKRVLNKKVKKQNEEVELDEAKINGREYASHGLMHPDHAQMPIHKVSGEHIDFYAHGTGDKIQGKVVYHDGKHVHIRATDGKKHVFKVQRGLPKTQNEEVELDESHFKVGDKVKCKSSGMKGKVVKLDKDHGADDEKYYTVKRDDGQMKKMAPNDMTKLDEAYGSKTTKEEDDMKEELKGDQHKIDANKNGKLDKFDFAKLRARRGKMQEAACDTDKKQVKEKLNLNTVKMGDVVKDFQKSDAPQFAGKSDKKRQQMAVAAKLEADRKTMKEEFQGFSSYLKVQENIAEEIIEEGMISHSDFNSMMAAQKKAGNRILDYKHGEKSAHYIVVDKEGTKRKVTYTETGKKMENMGGSTNKEKPAEPAEKRGRGRPKGSASGARLKGSAKDNDDDSGLDDTRYAMHLPSGRR